MTFPARTLVFALLGCLCLLLTYSFGQNPFQSPSDEKSSVKSSQPTEQFKQIIQVVEKAKADDFVSKLNQLVSLEIRDLPFEDFQALVKEKVGVELYLHSSARNDSLLSEDRFSFRCGGMTPFVKSLELILEDFHADFVIEGGLVKIVSVDEVLESEFLMRGILDARPLIRSAVQERLAMYSDDPEPPKAWEISMIVEEELIDMIQQTVAYDSWEASSGTGTVVGLNGVLVVSQSRKNLAAVEDLLNELTAKLAQ